MASSKPKITDRRKTPALFSKALFGVSRSFRALTSGGTKNGNSAAIGPETQTRLDKKLVLSLSKARIPRPAQLKYVKKFLSRRELWAVRICLLAIVAGMVWGGLQSYFSRLEIVPVAGGDYTEALVGQPKYINPLYADASDADHDITRLIYSSLFKYDDENGLVGDLAENRETSEDGKIYRLFIRGGVGWHDRESLPRDLNADDIIFTFGAIKDGRYKSPLKTAFAGVEIEKEGDLSVKFTLSEPYAAFLDLLTFGIMPADLWSKVPPESFTLTEFNLKPLGSGPYRFGALTRDGSGKIVEYALVPHRDYYEAPPLINIRFKFYPAIEDAVAALNAGQADGISYLPRELKESVAMPHAYNFHKLRLPGMNVLFFNRDKNPLLAEKPVRQALALAIDKNAIADGVMGGDAYIVEGPIFPDNFAYKKDVKKYAYDRGAALEALAAAGWKWSEVTAADLNEAEAALNDADAEDGADGSEGASAGDAEKILLVGKGRWQKKDGSFLAVKLTSVDKEENGRVLAAIRDFWEAIGVKTEIELWPASRIQTEIIKSRDFEVLFYGQMAGADPDPYALWHSSQVKEGGFNLAGYSHKEVDRLLEDARMISDRELRAEKYGQFQEILAEELPAIFLYSPLYVYVQDKKIKNFGVSEIVFPRDRFANVEEWYIKTGKKPVW